MSYAHTANITEIEDHTLNKFVRQTVDVLKLSAVQGINAKLNDDVYAFRPEETKGVAGVVAKRFAGLDAGRRQAVRHDLGRDAAITAAIRSRGVDMRSNKSVLEQVDLKGTFGFVTEDIADEDGAWRSLRAINDAHAVAEPAPLREAFTADVRTLESRYRLLLPDGFARDLIGRIQDDAGGTVVLNQGIKFRVREVKCIDETNPEWVGHDEIAWGGTSVDAAGKVEEIAEHYVRGGFDDGDKKTYSPPYEVCRFQFADADFPQTFLVMLSLAEKDSGGLSRFIHELYEAVKDDLQLIFDAMGAAAGAAIGGSIGMAGGPIGAVIGAVAGAIVAELVGWLVSALKDDIFAPRAASVTFNGPNDTFETGGLVSPVLNLIYEDHGGKYRVKYDWEIVR